MKRIICFLALLACVGSYEASASNTIQWGTQSTTGAVLFDSLGNALFGSLSEDGGGYLVQLIYAGENKVADVADVRELDGATVDDVVVAYAWVGAGKPPASREGQFTGAQVDNSYNNGYAYYIRAWDGASSVVGTGYVPSTTRNYGNSVLYTVSGNTTPPSVDGFYITPDNEFSTNLIAVPEPTTWMLAFFGLGLLSVRRLKRKFSGRTARVLCGKKLAVRS